MQELNRESWLIKATDELSEIIGATGRKTPEVRVSVGFPSKGGSRGKVIGECHASQSTTDNRAQIFIHPKLEDGTRVLGVLLHELIHATLGAGFGHGQEFKAIAVACGLTGKMTATTESPELVTRLNAVIERIGAYPHAELKLNESKQSTRMIKCECLSCGYIAYTSRKWLEELGAPICPCNEDTMRIATKGNK